LSDASISMVRAALGLFETPWNSAKCKNRAFSGFPTIREQRLVSRLTTNNKRTTVKYVKTDTSTKELLQVKRNIENNIVKI